MQAVSVPAPRSKQPSIAQLPPSDAAFEVLPHTLSVVYNQGMVATVNKSTLRYCSTVGAGRQSALCCDSS